MAHEAEEPMTKTTVAMTARQIDAISAEARRTGYKFNVIVRRMLDLVIDTWEGRGKGR
jgi:hypothetical protein